MASIEQHRLSQEAQKRKDAAICAEFTKLRKQYPNVGVYTIFDTIAEKYRKINLETGSAYPITTMGIRNVITRNGLYTPRKNSRSNDTK